MLVSFIQNEEYIKEEFLNTWNNDIKPKLYKVQPNNTKALELFINIEELDQKIQEKKILNKNKKDINYIKVNKNINSINDSTQKDGNDNIIKKNNNKIIDLNNISITESIIIDNENSTNIQKTNTFDLDEFLGNSADNNEINNKDKKSESNSFNSIKSNFSINMDDISNNNLFFRDISSSFIIPRKNNNFNFIEEEENEINFVLQNNKIKYISIDLFLKKIALENFEFNYNNLYTGFLNQFCTFMNNEILINKIISAFHYYSLKNTNLQSLINLINFLNNCIIQIYDYSKEIKFTNPIYLTLKNFYTELLKDNKLKLNFIEDILSLFQDEIPSQEDLNYVKNLIRPHKKRKNLIIKKQLNRYMTLNNIISTKIQNKNNSNPKFNIIDYRDLDISNQLTYISKKNFDQIEKKEILNAKYLKQNKEKDSPNIMKLIKNSNNLTNFVIENIISENNISNRAKIIEQWINVCISLKKNNNFNDIVAIQFALSCFIISSLENTWKKVKREFINTFVEFKNLCNPSENFKKLREATKNCINSPFIPFLAILLRDINSYDERFKYIQNEKYIDFLKILMVENVIDDFFRFKDFAYNITPISSLDFFNDIKCKSESELYDIFKKLKKK